MKYYKKGIVKGRWKFFELTDEEVEEIAEQLRKDNLKTFRMCWEDAIDMVVGTGETKISSQDKMRITRVAISLFDKLGTQLFTRIQNALDAKIKKAEEQTSYADLSKEKEIDLEEDKIRADSEPVMDSKTGLVIADEGETGSDRE